MKESEVIIAGAGPAGSSCAWKLKQLGKPVLLLDKQSFPRKKLCAGWITPGVLKDLETSHKEYPHGIRRYRKLDFHIKGLPLPVPTRQYAIRRWEFDHWLLERSEAPLIQHEVKEIRDDGDSFIIDDQYRCRYLVGAGGTGCRIYQTFFKPLNPRMAEKRITTLEEEFPYDYSDSRCHLWYLEEGLPGYSWYVPKANGYLNIGIGGKLAGLKAKNQTIRQHWNRLVTKLQKLKLVTDHEFSPRGYNYYLRQNVQTVQRDRIYIAGDAAGLATLDMGEGIGPAVRSGIGVAESIALDKEYSLSSIGKYSFRDILFPW